MKDTNTSATGGYLLPKSSSHFPCNLTLEQFVQTVLVGVSGLPGDLVRPRWQMNPPKQPDLNVNWLSMAITEDDADTFAFNGITSDGHNRFMRMSALTVQCMFYGPNAFELCEGVRDALQLGQNREALQRAKMDFVSTGKMVRSPDLVNERWVSRWTMDVYLRREILRSYPILTFLSFNGTLYTLQSSGVKTIAIRSV